MRLKGGKVLLDLTPLGDVAENDVTKQVSELDVKLCLEKGCEIYCLLNGNKILIPFIPRQDYQDVDIHRLYGTTIQKLNGDSVTFYIDILLNEICAENL